MWRNQKIILIIPNFYKKWNLSNPLSWIESWYDHVEYYVMASTTWRKMLKSLLFVKISLQYLNKYSYECYLFFSWFSRSGSSNGRSSGSCSIDIIVQYVPTQVLMQFKYSQSITLLFWNPVWCILRKLKPCWKYPKHYVSWVSSSQNEISGIFLHNILHFKPKIWLDFYAQIRFGFSYINTRNFCLIVKG